MQNASQLGSGHLLNDALEHTYKAIDHEIGLILDAAGTETRSFVFAPHGMGGLSHASWNLNEIIDLLGYGGPLANNSSGITTKAKVNPWRIIKKVAPARLLYAIKETLPKAMQEKLLFLWYAGQQKYHGRRAFAVPNNEAVGTIRINLKGRDHEGVVNPNEYWSLCEEISNSLTELTDPITRRPVVKKITLLHKECHGEHLDILPDIAVYWDSSFAWGSLRSPRFGTLQITSQDRRTGTHTPNSFLLAVGLGLPARLELRGHSVLDVAPTILDGFDVPIPDRFDGRPLGFAFEKQANSNPQA
jgi:predicted AlkP superfamily phosphohydrolase/phosphomutase